MELLQGQRIEVTHSGKLDRYGRTLGRLGKPQGDAGAMLLHEGLAQTYSAGAKAKADAWTIGVRADLRISDHLFRRLCVFLDHRWRKN